MSRKLTDEDARKSSVNVRVLPDLRAKLEAAAEASGRSLTQEAEARLLQTFDPYYAALVDVISANRKSGRVLRALANVFSVISFEESGLPTYISRVALASAFSAIIEDAFPKPAGLMADLFEGEDEQAKAKAEERFRQIAENILEAHRAARSGGEDVSPGLTLLQRALVLGLIPSDGQEASQVLEGAAKLAKEKNLANI